MRLDTIEEDCVRMNGNVSEWVRVDVNGWNGREWRMVFFPPCSRLYFSFSFSSRCHRQTLRKPQRALKVFPLGPLRSEGF